MTLDKYIPYIYTFAETKGICKINIKVQICVFMQFLYTYRFIKNNKQHADESDKKN